MLIAAIGTLWQRASHDQHSAIQTYDALNMMVASRGLYSLVQRPPVWLLRLRVRIRMLSMPTQEENGVFTAFDAPHHAHCDETSVQYASGKVLLLGVRFSGLSGEQSQLAEVFDLSQPSPQWQQVGNLTWRRQFPTGTLLPDGEVLVPVRGFAHLFKRAA